MLPESARTEPPLAARVSAAIILPVLIACLACLVLARPAFASTEYSDVDEDAWYKGCVTYVSNRGFMTGYEGTDLFGPEDLVTRAQAVTAIYRAVTGDPEGRTSDPARYSHRDDWSGFSDTYGNAYCTAAINWAAERGVFLWFCQVISLGSLPVFDNADAGPLGPAFFYSRQLVRLRKGPCPS